MANVKSLKNSRSGLKGSITRTDNKINSIDQSTVTRPEVDTMRKKILELHQKLIQNNQDIIALLIDEEEIRAEIEDQLNVDDLIFELDMRLSRREVKLLKAEKQEEFDRITAAGQPPPTQTTQPQATTGAPVQKVKLPELKVPKFTGQLEDWQMFKNRYEHAVHSRTDLKDAVKLQYLISYLEGPAARILSSVSIQDSSYAPAWQQIVDRFQHDRELAYKYVGDILDLPSMKTRSAEELQEIVSTVQNAQDSIRALGHDNSDIYVVTIVVRKLDKDTRLRFHQSLKDKNLPGWKILLGFLQKEMVDLMTSSQQDQASHQGFKKSSNQQDSKPYTPSCSICKSNHFTFKCTQLINASDEEKKGIIEKAKLCTNCLKPNHQWKQCKCQFACQDCKQKHHTILHKVYSKKGSTQGTQDKRTAALTTTGQATVALKPTALVKLIGRKGKEIQTRALIDNCADETFISASLVNLLGLKKEKLQEPISIEAAADVGICKVQEFVSLKLISMQDKRIQYDIEALILPTIGGPYPSQEIVKEDLGHLPTKKLADPGWAAPGQVSILLSNHMHYKIIRSKLIRGKGNQPIAQDSTLGWLIGGGQTKARKPKASLFTLKCTLQEELQKFWTIETLQESVPMYTTEERQAEQHYIHTTTRRGDGAYEVSLPFKFNKQELGESKGMAFKRLQSLENKFKRNNQMQQQYKKGIQELIDDGHMEVIPFNELKDPRGECYYLPHHAVFKESSTTTKMRIVFDASARTTKGVSLNDILMVGPTIQEDLFSILTRWRFWLIPLSADIRQMYLYIWVKPEDRDYQRILWREDEKLPIQQYRLKKVTFGTASAPFQAIRTLHKLAEDYQEEYPEASKVLKKDFYVDDCLTGRNTIQEAIALQQQLVTLASKGRFMLRKWASSSTEVLQAIPQDYREVNLPFELDKDDYIKALGMVWNHSKDLFQFQVQRPRTTKITKRSILSDIARVFDPLGMLSPVTIRAKMIMQLLWKEEVAWDLAPSTVILEEWKKYQEDLQGLSKLKIPRCINYEKDSIYSLQGFADASEKAYAAAVYLYCKSTKGCQSRLVASKSRVAPTKSETLPRLELCAAVLLAELLTAVRKALPIKIEEIGAWSDSTVTLAWIRGDAARWKTFERNRVIKIQELIRPEDWNHIPGISNPADLPSRGMSVEEFIDSSLWWHGPKELPERSTATTTRISVNITTQGVQPEDSVTTKLAKRHSCWFKLRWRTAVWSKFWNQARGNQEGQVHYPNTQDLKNAEMRWIRFVQKQEFQQEIKALKSKTNFHKHSKLKDLNAFIQEEVIKVGGRLRKAKEIQEDQKYPMVLPRHHITDLIIMWYHKRSNHAGPQLTMSLLQRRYWIIGARRQVRRVLHQCKICRVQRAATGSQMMADLPEARITPSRPFTHVGIDYAGPVKIRESIGKRRNTVVVKSYVAVFVCFATKAVHLELVSSLSTDSFLAALNRFVSRRGLPTRIYSDNGTNFVGAKRELKEIISRRDKDLDQTVSRSLAKDGIEWKMNPPAAPHMGGLWEAAVKSMKFHLARITNEATMTFEELDTLLKGVEACLNSRPLCPERSDPGDFCAITPGHFLIGEPLLALPEDDLTDLKVNTLSRWQRVQQLRRHFWNRWKDEYLQQLQRRTKWQKEEDNMKIGAMVVIKEENIPPQRWKLARVVEVFPDMTDPKGLVRAVAVQTADGILKRPVCKLVLLPSGEEEEEEKTDEVHTEDDNKDY